MDQTKVKYYSSIILNYVLIKDNVREHYLSLSYYSIVDKILSSFKRFNVVCNNHDNIIYMKYLDESFIKDANVSALL